MIFVCGVLFLIAYRVSSDADFKGDSASTLQCNLYVALEDGGARNMFNVYCSMSMKCILCTAQCTGLPYVTSVKSV